jgi:hypothetical protein
MVEKTKPKVPAGSPALDMVTPTAVCTKVAAAAATTACSSLRVLLQHNA